MQHQAEQMMVCDVLGWPGVVEVVMVAAMHAFPHRLGSGLLAGDLWGGDAGSPGVGIGKLKGITGGR